MLPLGSSQTINGSIKFPIKLINWTPHYAINESISTPILLQDQNGPCPLIALVNTLLLQNDFNDLLASQIRQGKRKISEPAGAFVVNNLKHELRKKYESTGNILLLDVLSLLGDLLLTLVENGSTDLDSGVVDELLAQLPKLHTGLNVDPNLLTGGFAPSLATELFDAFGLDFRHGWVVETSDNVGTSGQMVQKVEQNSFRDKDNSENSENPEDSGLLNIVRQLETYDRVQDYLLSDQENVGYLENKQLLTTWLNENQTQLTGQGLFNLNSVMEEGKFVIFFRNNHFNTLFRKGDDEFYLLVTDLSFGASKSLRSQLIWQSLSSVSGQDDLFFTGDFSPILDIEQDLPRGDNVDDRGEYYISGQDDTLESDLILLRQLQLEEDEAVARRMQEKFNKERKIKKLQLPLQLPLQLQLQQEQTKTPIGSEQKSRNQKMAQPPKKQSTSASPVQQQQTIEKKGKLSGFFKKMKFSN